MSHKYQPNNVMTPKLILAKFKYPAYYCMFVHLTALAVLAAYPKTKGKPLLGQVPNTAWGFNGYTYKYFPIKPPTNLVEYRYLNLPHSISDKRALKIVTALSGRVQEAAMATSQDPQSTNGTILYTF